MTSARRIFAPILSLLLWFFPGPVLALDTLQSTNFDPAFRTDARFVVGDEVHNTASALAWIEEHPAWGAGFYWLTIGFYPFQLTKQQIEEAASGSYQPIEDKITADYSSVDYRSHVKIILNIDEDNKISKVDMTLPGYACTIAPTQLQVEKFLQGYVFEGGRLRLKSNGSFQCFSNVQDNPGKTFQWGFDVDLPVFEFSNR